MQEVQVSLSSIDRVKQFVETLVRFDADLELISGKYIVNAKSILGIFSVDLSQPVLLRINADGEEKNRILGAIQEYRTNG